MAADFIEQDVVLTRDGIPIILHDIHLEPTTDVAERFPGRARDDGHFYAIDFSLAEIRTLYARERRNADGSAVFPARFPGDVQIFAIPTLAEEIALIDGLNRSREHTAGLYIEMKGSAFHHREGQDLPKAVMEVLKHSGWDTRSDLVYLQSFEPAALRYLKNELQTVLPLIQLIGENSWGENGDIDITIDYDALRSDAGLEAIAEYADGIGPWLMQLYQPDASAIDVPDTGSPADLATRAHKRGLLVHPYTFRADQLPPGIASFEELHRLFFVDLKVDGVFTDFPDLSRTFRDQYFKASKAP
jgi:glycerophosphoryl diester phosphodiesterase